MSKNMLTRMPHAGSECLHHKTVDTIIHGLVNTHVPSHAHVSPSEIETTFCLEVGASAAEVKS